MEVLAPASLHGRRRPWQDLPSELLGLVLLRIPSHASRVRLRAVCRPWRAGPRTQSPLPPLLPWLALRDGTFLSLSGGEVHRRVLTPDDDVPHRVSTGSMLFLVHSHEGCSLMNPLSRESTAPRHINLECLPTQPGVLLDVDNIRKVVVVSDQSSNLVWLWLPLSGAYTPITSSTSHSSKTTSTSSPQHVRVAVPSLRLYTVDIVGDDKSPVSIRCVFTTPRNEVDRWAAAGLFYYLVGSGDRLLMVKQNRKLIGANGIPFVEQELFEVFDMSSTGQGRWRKMDTLMGCALFISEGCSQSLPAAGEQCVGGAQDGCIYFLRECNTYDGKTRRLYSGIYNMKERSVLPLPFEMEAACDGPFTATWFFPDGT